MTVIRPNSVSGINSITAQANEIKVFKSNGTQGGLIIGGANLNATTGISTILALNVTGNVSIAGTLTYQDVTNVDSLGIGTFRTGINVSGGQLDVGSNIKLGNAGVVTATSFVGSLSGGSVSGTSGAFTGNIDLNSDTNKLKIGAGDDFQFFHNGSNNFIETNNGDIRIKTSDSSGNLTFTAGGSTERLRITSTGQLLVGTTSASNRFKNGNGNGATPKFQFETANNDEQNDISLTFGRNNAFGAEIILAKHRAATVGGHTIVQSDDRLGGINFAGSDGTHFRPAALIQGRVDGTPGTGDMPGRLEFYTTADNAATPTERMRIHKEGYVTKSVVPCWNLRPRYNSTQTTANTSSHHAIGWGANGTANSNFLQNCTLEASGFTYNLHNGQSYGKLKVPIAGRYYVNVTYRVENNPGAGNIYVYVNNSQIARQHVEMWAHRPYMHGQWASVLNLAANDTILISISCANANVSGYNDNVNWFSGYLIG